MSFQKAGSICRLDHREAGLRRLAVLPGGIATGRILLVTDVEASHAATCVLGDCQELFVRQRTDATWLRDYVARMISPSARLPGSAGD